MQYKNTIGSHCQSWDETNLLSIYSGKVIQTVEFHKGLGTLIDDCLFSVAYIKHLVGKLEQDLRFYFKDYPSFSLATEKRKTAAYFKLITVMFYIQVCTQHISRLLHSSYVTVKLAHTV